MCVDVFTEIETKHVDGTMEEVEAVCSRTYHKHWQTIRLSKINLYV